MTLPEIKKWLAECEERCDAVAPNRIFAYQASPAMTAHAFWQRAPSDLFQAIKKLRAAVEWAEFFVDHPQKAKDYCPAPIIDKILRGRAPMAILEGKGPND